MSSSKRSGREAAATAAARLPRQDWARIWLLVVLLVLVIAFAWEGFWRARGFVPNLSDDLGIWAMVRRRVSQQGDGVVLVGASRIQLGINPQAFAEVSGQRPLMLAIDGSSPLPVLEELAADQRFCGLVLVSLTPMHLAQPLGRDRAVKWVRRYPRQQWSQRLETRLSMAVQGRLVLRSTSLAPEQLWQHWREGSRPTMFYAPMQPDRSRAADFSRVDLERMRRSRAEREAELHGRVASLSGLAFEERIAHLRSLAETIRERGGRVVFVRFPSDGAVLALEQRDWPRARYWDPFAARVGTLAIHFQDDPRLSHFTTPDGSHLRGEDAVRFSRILAGILEEEHILRDRE